MAAKLLKVVAIIAKLRRQLHCLRLALLTRSDREAGMPGVKTRHLSGIEARLHGKTWRSGTDSPISDWPMGMAIFCPSEDQRIRPRSSAPFAAFWSASFVKQGV